MPEGIDPTSVTSTPSEDGRDLLLTGIKRVQENKKDEDLSGYKPDEIKVQLRGQELTVTGKQRSEENGLQWSRDFHRCILLPDDVDLSSVSSRLSKEGLLTTS
ncbi:heat shock protein Hsp-16.48/Hsp-16.49-like [Acropora muricata]|uniref:heat shock protein Hsp-16.48/Hsp-16.49-like n=1 Tax=Acropora muricata TaxID=159855 RepID=UPI0034E59579